jgi:cytochrome c oxidase subunit 4
MNPHEATPHEIAAHHGPSRATYLVIFVLLMAFLALTVWVAYLDLGFWNTPLALAIAFSKAILVILYFMHARYTGPLVRLVAVGAFVWLAVLIGQTLSDYLTRS